MRKLSLYILLLFILTTLVSNSSYSQEKPKQPEFFTNQSFSANGPPPPPTLIGDIGGGSDSVPIDDGIIYLFAGAIVLFSKSKIRSAWQYFCSKV